MTASAIPAVVSVLAVVTGAAVIAPFVTFGPLSAHMATHIAVMNVTAPLAAVLLSQFGITLTRPVAWLWTSAAAQTLLFLAWHLPANHSVLSSASLVWLTGFLAIAATCFWLSLLFNAFVAPYQAILSLLLTGKIACLLGGILVFAPRTLSTHPWMPAAIEDQQLAGLLMIAVCSLSYIVAGIAIAAQTLLRLERLRASASPAADRMPSTP